MNKDYTTVENISDIDQAVVGDVQITGLSSNNDQIKSVALI